MNIRLILSGLAACATLCAVPGTACAKIFETNQLGTGPIGSQQLGTAGTGTIGEYTTSGALVNSALVKGLHRPEGIAVSGGDLFVVNRATGTIGEYTTSGALVNAALISGLHGPEGIAVGPASVPDASSTWTLMLLGLTATFGCLKLVLRQPG